MVAGAWDIADERILLCAYAEVNRSETGYWDVIARALPGKTGEACRQRHKKIRADTKAALALMGDANAQVPQSPSKARKGPGAKKGKGDNDDSDAGEEIAVKAKKPASKAKGTTAGKRKAEDPDIESDEPANDDGKKMIKPDPEMD